MKKKQQVIFRLDSDKYQQLKQKLDNSNFSINQLFESLSELVLNGTIKITAFGISLADNSEVNLDNSLSKEIDILKKQLSDLYDVLSINYQNDSSKPESTVIKEIQEQIQQLEVEVRDAIAKDENQVTEILPSGDALREEIEEVKDESYQIEVEQSEKQNKDIEQKSSSLEGDRPSAITENINKEELEKKEISKEEKATIPETEKPKEDIPEKVRSLPTGTKLTGKELAFLMGVNTTYPSKYKSGKVKPPAWFWDNFEATGTGNKSRWVKK